jgi:hypothetical protein
MKGPEKGAVFVFLSPVSEVVEWMLYCFPTRQQKHSSRRVSARYVKASIAVEIEG